MLRISRLLAALTVVTALAVVPTTVAGAAEPEAATIGAVDQLGRWHVSDLDGDVASFYFGAPGDTPFMGDWNCDGYDTPGLYRSSDGFVYLRNSNTLGIADISFFFGNPGDVPLAGDFDGDGCDTVSLYRPAEARVFVINKLGGSGAGLGPAELDYVFGDLGDEPFAGDFDGDRIDTIGLHRPSTGLLYVRNSNTQGNAELSFAYGEPGDIFVAGDWTADGVDTPALLRPTDNEFYFLYTNSAGTADRTLRFGGGAGLLPLTGHVGDLAPGPDQVTGLNVTTGGGSGEIGVSWTAVIGASSYDVYWSLLPGDPKTVIASVGDSADQFGVPWEGDTRRYIDGLGARYPRNNLYVGIECYQVSARNAPGRESPLSAEKCFMPSASVEPTQERPPG